MTSPSGDVDQLDAWLDAWYVPTFRTACLILGDRAQAEEAAQEAFLRLWRFRASMPAGDGARRWLYRIVVNCCYSLARKERGYEDRKRRAQASGDDRSGRSAGPEELVEEDLEAAAVRAAVASLPEALRIPIVLRYYAGLSEKEIAVAIRRRPGTVKSRVHEARRRLGEHPDLVCLHELKEMSP
jgi:RNA polymerase sigma-70 factor (ECF subfamily)